MPCAQAQQQQATELSAAAQQGIAGAKALGDTDVGGGMNALQMILGNAVGGPGE